MKEEVKIKYKSKSFRLDERTYQMILEASRNENISKNRLFYYLMKLYDKHGLPTMREASGGKKARQTN